MCLKLLKKGLWRRAIAPFFFSIFRIENQKKDIFLMLSTSLLLIVPQILLASDASVVSEKLLSISTNDHLQECYLFVSFVFSFFVFFISNMKQTANLQEQREDLQGGSF